MPETSDESSRHQYDHSKPHRTEHSDPASESIATLNNAGALLSSDTQTLLGSPNLQRRANQPVQVALMMQMQRRQGNRALQRWSARQPAPGSVRSVPVVQRARETENQIMAGTGQGAALSNQNKALLIGKMKGGQELARAREIAAQIEAETAQLIQAVPAVQRGAVENAIKDYVTSSTNIQNNARGDPAGINDSVRNLDAALQAIRAQMTESQKTRIVYRSISYDSVGDIPYGRAGAPSISVGDAVYDTGFLSTSEHRQFILGKTQTKKVAGLLRLAIHGKSGVPIAIHFFEGAKMSYSNANEKAMWDIEQKKKSDLQRAWESAFGAGPAAGQAEVLFPRNTTFAVTTIERTKGAVNVVLEEITQGGPPPVKKNMKTGVPG